MKWENIAKNLDDIFLAFNILSIMFLFLGLWGWFSQNDFPAWIYVGIGGSGFQGSSSIQLWPIMIIAVVFFISQIYLNVRILGKNSSPRETPSGQRELLNIGFEPSLSTHFVLRAIMNSENARICNRRSFSSHRSGCFPRAINDPYKPVTTQTTTKPNPTQKYLDTTVAFDIAN